MTKRIDWDQVSRRQKGRRQGISNAYDELPPVGSWADRQRVSGKQGNPKKKLKKKTVKKSAMKRISSRKKRRATVRVTCPLCGMPVANMKLHLRQAHGAVPGHEHEDPSA